MKLFNPLKNENGAVLIIGVIILVAITAIGLTLNMMSNTERDIATNEKCAEQARYNAESSTTATSKLISLTVDLSAGIPAGSALAQGVNYAAPSAAPTAEEEFLWKVMGVIAPGATCNDVDFTLVGMDNASVIRDREVGPITGGAGTEYSAGYTQGGGLPGVSGGGTAVFLQIASRGGGCYNANHVVYSQYRKVLKMSGDGDDK